MRAACGWLTSIPEVVWSDESAPSGTGSYLDMITRVSNQASMASSLRYGPMFSCLHGPGRGVAGEGNFPERHSPILTVRNRVGAEGDVFSNANNRGCPKRALVTFGEAAYGRAGTYAGLWRPIYPALPHLWRHVE
jgi:hypothetical protein